MAEMEAVQKHLKNFKLRLKETSSLSDAIFYAQLARNAKACAS
jgi:hypothetical protein